MGQGTNYRNKTQKRGEQVRAEKAGKTADLRRAPQKQMYLGVYKVNRSDELLEFLLKKCNTSRNNVKSFLARGQVLVNGSVVTQYNLVLAKDDEVKISKTPLDAKSLSAVRQKANPAKPQRRAPVLKILYEDDEFIAVDKPVGLLSVESDKEQECAFGYVMDYLRAQNKNARPFILHRIDKETSGVLIFAKDVKIHSMLKLRWNEQVTLREYHAVVEGKLAKKEDTLVAYLKENANNLVYVTHDASAQKAVTHYKVLKENEKFSLLEVRIDTGRKNQIRVQMKELKHSVVGDEKYGYIENPLGRLGLHASKLEFKHPVSGEVISISSPVPQAFRGLFK